MTKVANLSIYHATYVQTEVLGQGEFGHEEITGQSPDEPTYVKDRGQSRVLGPHQIQIFSDTE
jgi:hypothetical protein